MPHNHIPVAAPIDSDSAGRGGAIATQACVRVLCPAINSSGTGFLHPSGNIITAQHVVGDCPSATLILSNLTAIPAKVIATDPALDLALIEPTSPIAASPLTLSSATSFSLGAHVSTWGYPGGYRGAAPMLSAGYLAALDAQQVSGGEIRKRWVVNAAFNSGNSGGPLLLIETGEVIGVVSSKLAPISPYAHAALKALEGQASGMVYTATKPDGTTEQMSEGKVVSIVLNELRAQVQLVIGYAVLLEDLRGFLTANSLTP